MNPRDIPKTKIPVYQSPTFGAVLAFLHPLPLPFFRFQVAFYEVRQVSWIEVARFFVRLQILQLADHIASVLSEGTRHLKINISNYFVITPSNLSKNNIAISYQVVADDVLQYEVVMQLRHRQRFAIFRTRFALAQPRFDALHDTSYQVKFLCVRHAMALGLLFTP